MDELPIWEPTGLVAFSEEVGILGFLQYSHYIEAAERDSFLTLMPDLPPPAPEAIAAAVSRYINADEMGPASLPNIMIVHAESTFDPNEVFHLSAPLEDPLYYSHPGPDSDAMVRFSGPAITNVIGGGSWVSEFEVITGLDSRLFGVAGRFTHASLSSYSRNTFPMFLDRLGYETAAFSNVEATFYNYAAGYLNYGFDHFFDRSVVGSKSDDMAIMRAALDQLLENPDAPFMKFVLLARNHGPHWCDEEYADEYEPVALIGDATAEMNCAVAEYHRRTRLTSDAIAEARAFLDAEKRRTGRDYVIAIYGDHQPYSFTDQGEDTTMGLDFSSVRQDETKRSWHILVMGL